MKQRSFRSKRRIIFPLALVIAVAVVGAVAFVRHGKIGATAPPKSPAAKSVQSQFSFTGAANWHKGPTNETSMALFGDDGSCFTSIEHKKGTVDVAADLQKQQSDLAGSGGTMTPVAIPTATVQTNAGVQQYELHQFNLASGDSSSQLMGGLELGYVQLPNGYLEIQGHCNTADQLPTTIPALEAYVFDSTK